MRAYFTRIRAASDAYWAVQDEMQADEVRRARDGGPWEEDQRFHDLNDAAWAATTERRRAFLNLERQGGAER